MSRWGRTDQEGRLDDIFGSLEADFSKLGKGLQQAKAAALLKEVTRKLRDANT